MKVPLLPLCLALAALMPAAGDSRADDTRAGRGSAEGGQGTPLERRAGLA